MLTQDEWDALTPEDQATRQDEKPQAGGEPPQNQTIDELTTSVKDLKTQLDSLQNEKQGIYHDLKQEREVRQQLEATLGELQDRGRGDEFDLESMADDDYLTAGQVKKLMTSLKKDANRDTVAEARQKSAENYAENEEAMVEKTKTASDEFPVPYDEAIAEFQVMAKAKPAFWRAVQEESLRTNGKPAETAYRIALTSKKFIAKIRANTRESLLDKLENEGQLKPRKLPSGGPGKPVLNAANLTEEQIMNLSDSQLDELLANT